MFRLFRLFQGCRFLGHLFKLGLKALSVASIANEQIVMVRIGLKRKAGGEIGRHKKAYCSEDIYERSSPFV